MRRWRTTPAEQRYAEALARSDDALRSLPEGVVEAPPEPVRSEIRRRRANECSGSWPARSSRRIAPDVRVVG